MTSRAFQVVVLLLCATCLNLMPQLSAALVGYSTLGTWTTAMTGAGDAISANEPFNASLLATTQVTPLAGSDAHTAGFPSIAALVAPCTDCVGTVWLDFVRPALGYTTTFSYGPGSVMGFGANWSTAPQGPGDGLSITVNYQVGGSDTISGVILPTFDSWYGWTSTQAISSVVITSPGMEHYEMDNLVFGYPSGGIPEPGTMLLLGAGLLALGLLRRKKS